ncbi:hypothetical protein B2G71_12505 [Novosphingobium sp. PC22D]|uniref:TonB-dependent receptor n=1 Tax=Novosphingobium sp. PC22D TaxID=1962403 RepID=UPI000BF0C6AA|nr:TonB-dependent receptor [Novosphingobium sp. PC22D]PEQ12316.1 hypothetical protein B2G71_12505 [Novosphingobium sp. PC22D]
MGKAFLLAAAAGGVIAWTAPAAAQDAPQSARVEKGDIIVTARKRQESVLQVPVIETVISGEELQQSQVNDINALTEKVAGLQVGGNVLTVGTQISLRGVGTSTLDAGVDQSVSLNIDGLQLTQGASYSVGVFDMAQIEVLKGPQALFFGKNSPGGVIAIRTADPGLEPELIARAIYGFEAREKRGELIMSGPLGDTLGVRVAAMYAKDDGYFFNKATALPGTGAVTPSSDRYNGGDEYIVRGTVVWEPAPGFSARLKINRTEKEVVGGGAPYGSCPDGIVPPPFVFPIPQFVNPNEDCKIDRTVYIVDLDPAAFPNVRRAGVPGLSYATTFGTLELNADVASQLTLTSTSGYYRNAVDGLLNGVNSGYSGPTLIADNDFDRRDFTQELRLQSDWSSPLNFLVGGFYQDAYVRNRVYVGGNRFLGLPTVLTAGINDVSIEVWSAFGQARWQALDSLEIAAGVRYTDEKRSDDAARLTGLYDEPTPITVGKPSIRSKNWSPELTITYTPTDDFTVFGALKQGYKSGSYILTAPPAPGVDNSFGDEKVQGGEVGVKARVADRALTLNGAFYYYKYSDLQVGANEVAQGGIPVIRTINAGKSKVYGLDFDVTYRPAAIDGLTAFLAVNWNHARFTEFDGAPCYGGQTIALGCDQFPTPVTDPGQLAAGFFVLDESGNPVKYNGQNLAGAPLPKAADWTGTASIDYETPFGSNLMLGLGVSGQYSSSFLRGLGRKSREDLVQPAYAKLNANVRIGAEDGGWEVSLVGNNLTNKYTAGNCTTYSGATGQVFASPVFGTPIQNASGVDELACIPDRGRQVFLRLTLKPTAW